MKTPIRHSDLILFLWLVLGMLAGSARAQKGILAPAPEAVNSVSSVSQGSPALDPIETFYTTECEDDVRQLAQWNPVNSASHKASLNTRDHFRHFTRAFFSWKTVVSPVASTALSQSLTSHYGFDSH